MTFDNAFLCLEGGQGAIIMIDLILLKALEPMMALVTPIQILEMARHGTDVPYLGDYDVTTKNTP